MRESKVHKVIGRATDKPECRVRSGLSGKDLAGMHLWDHPCFSKCVTTSVRIVQEFSAIENEAQRWTLLAHESNSPMHQYAWMKACSTAFATEGKLQFIVVGAEQPSAVGPLVMRGGRLNRMECLGVDALYEPTDFPHSDATSLQHLIRALVDLRRPMLLRRVLADSPVLTALRTAFESKGILLTRPSAGYPWIDLDSSWSEPEKKLSASRRSSLRRARRKAQEAGPIRFEIFTPTPAELPSMLAEMFRVEAANWKGRNGSALLNDSHRRRFYEQYAMTACEKGILRLSFMKIGEKAIASQLAVESRGGFWLLKVGYDESYAHCSPGNLLLVETLKYAVQRGLTSYEFLGTAEPWTEVWTRQVRQCVTVAAYPNNCTGGAALIFDVVKFGWKRLSRKLFS
jgi:CelD/BcsL family acetyltransferase involved in cellulose biosynthesis